MARKKSDKNYFTKETEDYIIKYNNSTDSAERDKIFREHIYFPFYKLVENIIHTFKFYHIDTDSIESLKFEIISVLVEDKIKRFDPTNGAKAYSYFGTIVKRWLIAYTNQNYNTKKRVIYSDTYNEELEDTSELTPVLDPEKVISNIVDTFIEDAYLELSTLYQDEKDIQVADAVLTLFKNRRDLDILKKKAIYIYVREITDCTTPRLTKVIRDLKTIFNQTRSKYYLYN